MIWAHYLAFIFSSVKTDPEIHFTELRKPSEVVHTVPETPVPSSLQPSSWERAFLPLGTN